MQKNEGKRVRYIGRLAGNSSQDSDCDVQRRYVTRCSTKCLPPLPSSVRACPTADRGQLFSMRGNSPLRAYPPQRVRPDIHTISPLPIYDSCRIVVSHFAGMCVRNHLFGCLNEERVGYRLTDWPVCKLKSVTKSTPLHGPAARSFSASELQISRGFGEIFTHTRAIFDFFIRQGVKTEIEPEPCIVFNETHRRPRAQARPASHERPLLPPLAPELRLIPGFYLGV